MKSIRLALVGCGPRGIYIASLFHSHPQCEVTTLVDVIPSHLQNAVDGLKLPNARTYADFETMLKDAPVDAVFFASDPAEQADLAVIALDAGRHVCTEVPAAVSMAQCAGLVRAVEKSGCKYQLMEQTRYWGFVDVWKGMRERGELGHVCLAQGEYIHFEHWDSWVDTETGERYRQVTPPEGRKVVPTWRQKILAEPIYYLPHTLSPLLKILDDRVVRVSCMGTRRGSYTYQESALPWTDIQYALMHTAGDTVLLVGAGFSLPHVHRGQTGNHWYELRGNKGAVTSPRCPTDHFHRWHPGMDTFEVMDLSPTPVNADNAQAKSGHGGADFKPVDTFIRAIIDDSTPPMDVYRTVEMTAPAILAAESARQNGAMLEVPDFRKLRC